MNILPGLWFHGWSQGFRRSLRVARYEWRLQRMHRQAVRKARAYSRQTDLKLNLGCGKNHKPGWIGIDRDPSADLQLDLREDLPFADNSAAVIYSEHFFEHLQYPKEASHFLRECLRILKPGGVLHVGVPDTEWPVKAYSVDTEDYFKTAKELFHPKWCDTKMHHLNFHFRQGDEHKYAYDEETLSSVLTRHGFVSIRRRSFDAQLDTPSRGIGTLYMQCTAPP